MQVNASSFWSRLEQHPDVRWLPVPLPTTDDRPHVGIFAKRDIAVGERILYNAALAVVPTAQHCWYCLHPLGPSDLACSGCTARYCSPECRIQHKPQHRAACGRRLSPEADLLVQAAGAPQLPLTAARSGRPLCLRADWACLMALLPRGEPTPAGEAAAAVGADPIEVLQASRRLHNHFGISDECLTTRGGGVFPFGALLNHSCVANTAAFYVLRRGRRPVQCFVALTPIARFAELTHNYCDLVQARERRWEALGFQCGCTRCRAPWAAERLLVEDPSAQEGLAAIAEAEALPPAARMARLAALRCASPLAERQRWIRLVPLLIAAGRVADARVAAQYVFSIDSRFYAYPTHPSLVFQRACLKLAAPQ